MTKVSPKSIPVSNLQRTAITLTFLNNEIFRILVVVKPIALIQNKYDD